MTPNADSPSGSSFPVIVIGGPTASGKSAVALGVARWLRERDRRAVILNADALQLYHDLRVISARPDPAEEAEAPHRLYGVLDGAERGSVARWLVLVKEAIAEAEAEGGVPVVVGGSGLYLHALLHGLAPVPDIDPALRAEAEALYHAEGGAAFRHRLAALDPEAAALLKESDTSRLLRAYEVVKGTGRPLSVWQAEGRQSTPSHPAHWRFRPFVIEPARAGLYAACDRRFRIMMQRGAREEAERLRARHLDPTLPVMKAVGVPELIALLEGRVTEEDAVERASRATRHYAKRQLTWLRHRMDGVPRFSPALTPEGSALTGEVDRIAAAIAQQVLDSGSTRESAD